MEIRKLTADLKPALDLVWGVFLEYTAPDFSEEGVETFRRFIDHDGMASAVADGSCDLWAAFLGPAPVGVIAAALFLGIFLYSIKKRNVRPQYDTLKK